MYKIAQGRSRGSLQVGHFRLRVLRIRWRHGWLNRWIYGWLDDVFHRLVTRFGRSRPGTRDANEHQGKGDEEQQPCTDYETKSVATTTVDDVSESSRSDYSLVGQV